MYILHYSAKEPIITAAHNINLWQKKKGYSALMCDSAMRTGVSINEVDANENLLLKSAIYISEER